MLSEDQLKARIESLRAEERSLRADLVKLDIMIKALVSVLECGD